MLRSRRFQICRIKIEKSKEENVAVFIVCKENLEEQLQKYCRECDRFEETLEENEENEKILENCESVIMEAS